MLSLLAFAPVARAQGQPTAPTAPAPTTPAESKEREKEREKPEPPPPPKPPPPDVPVSSDTRAPSVPGQDPASSAKEKRTGTDPARTVQEAPSAHEGRFEFGSYG